MIYSNICKRSLIANSLIKGQILTHNILRRRFSSAVTLSQTMEHLTFYSLLLPNLYTGCEILCSERKLKHYNWFNVLSFSIIKSWFYSSWWWIFWPYALTRSLILPEERCYIPISTNVKWEHNFNGMLRHFIPLYYDVVRSCRGVSVDQLQEDNNYLGSLFPDLYGKFISILDRIKFK
jgi:hypothetical protein